MRGTRPGRRRAYAFGELVGFFFVKPKNEFALMRWRTIPGARRGSTYPAGITRMVTMAQKRSSTVNPDPPHLQRPSPILWSLPNPRTGRSPAGDPRGPARISLAVLPEPLQRRRPGREARQRAGYPALLEDRGRRIPEGTYDCVSSWQTDFRKDLATIDIPTLIIHGDADRICPLPITGELTNQAVKGSRLVVIPGGPHGLIWTHGDAVNKALVEFFRVRED
jgi:pimeloyl-ACP methyl ester carboxylesterase